MKDVFNTELFDYGKLQLIADTLTDTAKLQLLHSAYTLPLVAEVKKDAAFVVFNNASINTYAEMVHILVRLGGR